VPEALNSLSGINVISNGGLGTSASVKLRGFDTKRVLVLIDGIRVNDVTGTSGAPFEHLMINDIERIEVVKGAQSGIWGADASAGVINIITSSAKKGFHGNASVETGSFNTKKYGMTISNKTDKYDVGLSVNRLLTDGFSSQVPYGENPDDYVKNGYRNTTVNLKGGYNLTDSDRVIANYNHINSLSQYDGNTGNETKRSDNKSNLYSVTYNKIYENHDIKLKYDISKFDKEQLDATSLTEVKNYNGETTTIELTDKISYLDNDNVIVGVNKEKTEVDYLRVNKNADDSETKNKAVFL